MTVSDKINEIIDRYDELTGYIHNLETYIGTTDNRVGTLVERIHLLEDTIDNTRLIVDDRLSVTNGVFVLSKLPKLNSNIVYKIYDIINSELCEVAELENSDVSINYNTGEVTLNTNEYNGNLVKATYISSEV